MCTVLNAINEIHKYKQKPYKYTYIHIHTKCEMSKMNKKLLKLN